MNGVARTNWKAALAPNYSQPRETKTEVSSQIWECLKSDFLRPEEPSFSACYRRVATLAKDSGWGAMPNARTLRRKLDAEVPREVQVLVRNGKDAAKTIYPAQRRTRAHMHAMQAVNMDGHKHDVFVKLRDTGAIGRMYLIALQDLYSNKFVGWRLAYSENKETVRLCISDMVDKFGIPEEIYLDNGRSFESKWITGGMKTRYRSRYVKKSHKVCSLRLVLMFTGQRLIQGNQSPLNAPLETFAIRLQSILSALAHIQVIHLRASLITMASMLLTKIYSETLLIKRSEFTTHGKIEILKTPRASALTKHSCVQLKHQAQSFDGRLKDKSLYGC